jgi:hypothetical protein
MRARRFGPLGSRPGRGGDVSERETFLSLDGPARASSPACLLFPVEVRRVRRPGLGVLQNLSRPGSGRALCLGLGIDRALVPYLGFPDRPSLACTPVQSPGEGSGGRWRGGEFLRCSTGGAWRWRLEPGKAASFGREPLALVDEWPLATVLSKGMGSLVARGLSALGRRGFP